MSFVHRKEILEACKHLEYTGVIKKRVINFMKVASLEKIRSEEKKKSSKTIVT